MKQPSARSARDSFVTIAIGYGMGETTLALAYLIAHGIAAHALALNHVSVSWHLVTAFGGVEIRVPASQATRATELLSVPDRPMGRFQTFRAVLACLILTVVWPLPASGISVLRRSPVSVERPN